jgi:glycine betaine/proline transport system substrate-binding protein
MNAFRLVLAALGALVLTSGPGRAEEPGTVVMGQIGLSFYAVTAGVVHEVLERLGHKVEVRTGSHAQIFPELGAGEVDLLVAAWLPHGHAVYWQQFGSQAEQVAVLYRGARFDWMVPACVPAWLVSSVADLAKPEVAARMVHEIQGTGRDSGNMMLSAQVMQAYGLEQAGYRLVPGNLAQFHGAYDRGIAAGDWFVMPLWRPHYINKIGNMRALAEPRGLLGPDNDGTLVANKAWLQRAPARSVAVLRRIQLGLDAVEEMDYAVNIDKLEPRAAARAWMDRNRDAVELWFAGG